MDWSDARLNSVPWDLIGCALHWENRTAPPAATHSLWMRQNTHRHSFAEIVVCLEGRHAYGLNGRAVPLRPGGALFIARNEPHDATYFPGQASCLDFWIHLLPGGPATMKIVDHQPGRNLRMFPIPIPAGGLIDDLRRACFLTKTAPGPCDFSGRKTAGFLTFLLQEIFEKLTGGGYRTAGDQEAAVVEAIKTHVRGNLGDRLTLTELAAVAGYSASHFHRMFLRIEGVTPRSFVLARRLEAACRLLSAGHSVTSVALDCGFVDSSQFARTFRSQLGQTPSQWRNSAPQPVPAHRVSNPRKQHSPPPA